MAILDPTVTRLSPHFLLSDVMGCSSIYSKGLANVFDKKSGRDIRLDNLKALCEHALEPILALQGSFSISYGFISPEVSRELVTYQDWRKPSHHRADLGAAVDILPHHYTLQSIANHATPETGAPILFALDHLTTLPLSRLITYSESPYICVAVSAEEIESGEIRGAWYENRFEGQRGAKPKYIKYSSQKARDKGLEALTEHGLPCSWAGCGHPTYHGGGKRQLHHMRVSQKTMVTDWLFDEEFVRTGVKNQPALNRPEVLAAFETAGKTYDYILAMTGLPRVSIVSAYTSHLAPGFIEGRDWRKGDVVFEIVPPEYLTPEEFIQEFLQHDVHEGQSRMLFGAIAMEPDRDRVTVTTRRDQKW